MDPPVYVIEDDAIFRETARNVLEHAGYRAETFASAEAAMQALSDAARRPRALVVDLGLPGLDGGSFADWLARQPKLAGIPVVIITGKDGQEQNFRFSVVATLRKPFDNHALVEALEEYAGGVQ